ncbi:mechanosensitive ion channel family protein [Aerococcaceae bacterium DSM 111022]|nr:mechanosensitive ion channel family protein [Aerococcaceae bacterium DSM 111022]
MNFQEIVRYFLSDDASELLVNFTALILQITIITILFQLAKSAIDYAFKSRISSWLRSRNHMSGSRSETIANLMRNAIIYILYFVYFYWLLTLIGIPIGTLLAGAGIAGVAIGFGAQELIQDIINGFFIIFEGYYEIGDLVTLPEEDITGTVVSVGIRTTEIKAASGEMFFIPNSAVIIVNNQSRQSRSINLDLPVADGTPIGLLESVVQETTENIRLEYNDVLVDDPDLVGFVRGLEQTFNYRITFTVKNGEQYKHESIFYREYLKAFENNSIDIPNSVYDSVD